jgi:branched-chain amino acid transport system ATP-binding protein
VTDTGAAPGPVPALEVRDLVAGYEPGLPIVRGASLAVAAGEVVALLGPNGAGKSTLLKAVAGLVAVESGRVTLGGRDLAGVPAHDMIRTGLAYVPQTENVFARMTVDENLELAGFRLGRGPRRERIGELYALFPDLGRQRRLRAGRLSGGQRQMLAFARALMGGPRVLMLDEPSAGLAPKLAGLVFAKVREVRAAGVAILMVEQNVRAALGVADRAYVLVEGRERIAGPAAVLRDDPEVAHLYLGGTPGTAGRAPESGAAP